MSETLAKALLAFQADAPNLQRDKINPHFRSRYLSLEALMEQLLPVLNKHGLVLIQKPTVTEGGAAALTTKVIHADSGEFESDTMLLAAGKPDPQGQGSAITYARRYAAMSFLGLVADEDDDANKASAPPRRDPAFQAPPDIRSHEETQPANGDDEPGLVRVHFGKNAGKRLGDLSPRQREWYASTWEPNPQYANDVDRRLKMAARILCGAVPGPDDDLPF